MFCYDEGLGLFGVSSFLEFGDKVWWSIIFNILRLNAFSSELFSLSWISWLDCLITDYGFILIFDGFTLNFALSVLWLVFVLGLSNGCSCLLSQPSKSFFLYLIRFGVLIMCYRSESKLSFRSCYYGSSIDF